MHAPPRSLLPVWTAVLSLLVSPAFAGETNIAFGKPVKTSGGTTNPAANITDGDASTFSHPASTASGFYFQIDLGAEYPLQTIELYSRVNCCPDRLARVRMSVLADHGGVPGAENWGYVIRPDGSNNVQGAVDVVTGDLNPAGVFRGRYIRIANTGGASQTPQIAEIQVFEASTPEVAYFGPDEGNITKTGKPDLPSESTLSWRINGATSVTLDQGIGTVNPALGSVVVSPAVNTVYTLTATNGGGIISRTVSIGVDQVAVPPTISEFLATNTKGLQDSAGNRPDWIEIANPNAFSVNLKDWYLSDNPSNPVKWRFPSFPVPANGYALVFADGSGKSMPWDIPHTNFSLSATGEYLGLSARNGITVHSTLPRNYPAAPVYPPQFPDHSYGESSGVSGYFLPPTPGAANGPPFAGVVAELQFSVSRGFYDTPQSLALTSATPDTQIRYTTNGSLPSATTGTLYSTPIELTGNKIIRAIGFRPGWAPTEPVTHTYIFPASVISSTPWLSRSTATGTTYGPQMVDALKQVPSMSLTVGPQTIDGGSDKLGTLEWIDPAGGPGFQIPCGAKLFGGAYTDFAKKSYRLTFKSEYGAGKLKFPLFAGFERGWAAADEFDQIELRSGSHDMVERGFYLSNIFTDATMLDMGAFASHGRFVHLYQNGVYWGLYHLRERWGASMVSSYYGGPEEAHESINGNLNVGGWADPGVVYDGTGSAWTRIRALARQGAGNYQALRPYLDVSQYIDYMIMFMFGDSEDEYRASGPAEAGHGFKFQLNDADGYLRTSAGNRTSRSTPGRQSGDGPGSLFSLLHAGADPDYRTLLADRIQRAYIAPGGALTPARNAARLSELSNAVDKAIIAECARWNYRTPANWTSSRNAILSGWFPSRTNTVLGNYRSTGFYPNTAAPVAGTAPGEVASGSAIALTSSTSGSTLYYTTDGTDPRLSGETAANIPLVTSSSSGKFRVPATADEGLQPGSIPNLLGYWPMDGNTQDATGAFPGTIGGSPAFVAGRYGSGAIQLSGSGQYVSLGNPDGLKITGEITMAAWVKPDMANGIRNIVNKGHDPDSNPNGEITLRISAGAWQGGYWAGGSTAIASSPTSGENSAAADVGKWTHVAIVYDGGSWRLYRNGVPIAETASSTGAVMVPAVGWAIGARGTGTERFFDGSVDEVRIYNRGLTPAEIGSLYDNTATTRIAAWTTPGYNDSDWSSVAGAPGFAAEGSPLAPWIGCDSRAAMLGVKPTGYLRLPFSLTAQEKADTRILRLTVRADDGYTAWLNGNRIASRYAPATPDGLSAATAFTSDSDVLLGETIDLSSSLPQLVAGENILALQGLNVTADDDDFLLSATLNSARGIPGLSLQAVTYLDAPVLTKSTILSARAWNPANGQWSALLQNFYQVGPQPCPAGSVVVSEIHYHPAGDGDGEFLELLNVSVAAVNLRGATFSNGITFTFPDNRDTLLGPGQRLVLVDSEYTFQLIQGWSAPLGGIYSGNLSNGGEKITLTSGDRTLTIFDLTYGTTDPWPVAADGTGRSLVLIAPRVGQDLSDPATWRPSRTVHGNPNTTDAVPFSGIAERDLDGDGIPAFMEFALGTSDLIPNTGNFPPLPVRNPITGLLEVTLEHAPAADIAFPVTEASTDLQLWNYPASLKSRILLPNGRLQSTWTLPADLPRLFLRLRVGAP